MKEYKNTIICSPDIEQEIYNYLTSPLSGEGTCLSGCRDCHDEHPQINGLLGFNLTSRELSELSKKYTFDYEDASDAEFALDDFTLIELSDSAHGYAVAGANMSTVSENNTNLLSHHLYHCQQIDVDKGLSDFKTPSVSLSSIDCSNVDIVIVDSGVDNLHEDVKGQCVDFDWAQLRNGPEGNTGSLVSNFPSAYNSFLDTNGHGTACASAAAGKRSGLAKNAKIYSLKIFGENNASGDRVDHIAPEVAMQVCLAFMKAKNNNHFGLDSSRPTVFSNSWGSGTYNQRLPTKYLTDTHSSLTSTIQEFNGGGQRKAWYAARHNRTLDALNFYVEKIVNEGGHWLASAGNNNASIDCSILNRGDSGYPDEANPPTQSVTGVSKPYMYLHDPNSSFFDGVPGYPVVPPTAMVVVTKEMETIIDTISSTTITVPKVYTTGTYDLNIIRLNLDSVYNPDGRRDYDFFSAFTNSFTLSVTHPVYGTIAHRANRSTSGGVGTTTRRRHINKYLLDTNSLEYSNNYTLLSSDVYDIWDKPEEIVSIIVGDVTPVFNPFDQLIGRWDTGQQYKPYSSGLNAPMVHSFLSGMNVDEQGDFLFDTDRVNSLSAVNYVKTEYSCFGPDVDVYAPGNGILVAKSRYSTYESMWIDPAGTVSLHNTYVFFNGTSAACPVAAGCLATFLAVHPNATPRQAKEWLVNSSIKGNILETSYETFNDNISADNIYDNDFHVHYESVPHDDAKSTDLNTMSLLRYATSYYRRDDDLLPNLSPALQRLAMLHNHRFFRSHNRVVQAYPVRKSILKYTGTPPASVSFESSINSSNMELSAAAPVEKKTHNLTDLNTQIYI